MVRNKLVKCTKKEERNHFLTIGKLYLVKEYEYNHNLNKNEECYDLIGDNNQFLRKFKWKFEDMDSKASQILYEK